MGILIGGIVGLYVVGSLWALLGALVTGTGSFGFDFRRGFYRMDAPMDPDCSRFLRTGRWGE